MPMSDRSKAVAVALFALSPTYLLADVQKRKRDPAGRTMLIRRRNVVYLVTGMILAGIALVVTRHGTGRPPWSTWWPIMAPIAWYLQSRCHEIFLAFYFDAFDKLRPGLEPSSTLEWPTRVRLALNSYVELTLDFSVLYAMLPADMWQKGAQRPGMFTDLLTYSAMTITTSGGGGFVACHPLLQLMSTYEVFCGLLLLVVSFTIYTGRGLSERSGN